MAEAPKTNRDAPEWAAFYECLRKKGLRRTSQRETIFDVFMRSQKHMSSEDLYRRVKEEEPNVGFTTVYRTLNLLAECGLAIRSQFGDGLTRYESGFNTAHHDHLICVECGEVTEFFSPRLEHVQDEVVSRHGFEMTDHSLRIWGICRNCRRGAKTSRKLAAAAAHRND